MNDIVSFSVNGESYDIPKSEVDGFLSEFPDAVEVQTFISDKDTFDIPLDEVDGFKSEFPDAKEMLSVKKKGQTEPTQGTSTPVVSDVSEEPTQSPVRAPKGIKRTTEVKLPQYDLQKPMVSMLHFQLYFLKTQTIKRQVLMIGLLLKAKTKRMK
jgi:hypothetical protein